jgi:hypothetical protein
VDQSRPENWTLWHPNRDCQRSEQQALWFDTLNWTTGSPVGCEPGEAVIWETKAIESADKNTVIDRVESLGQVDEDACTVLSFINGGYDILVTEMKCLRPLPNSGAHILIGLYWKVSYRRNMKCIPMVAVKRERFGDYGKIIRLKVRTQQFTWHKTESKYVYVHFTFTVLFTEFVDNNLKILWIHSVTWLEYSCKMWGRCNMTRGFEWEEEPVSPSGHALLQSVHSS